MFARAHGHGVELVLPWRDDFNAGGHLLHLGLALCPLVLAAQGGGSAVLVMCAVIAGLYLWLTTVLNRTTILVGRSGVEISHGPLPTHNRTRTVASAQLRGLRLSSYSQGIRYRSTFHQLEAPGLSGALTRGWNRPEALGYVRDVILQVQGSAG